MTLTGLLLLGGASSRFGSPKALAHLDGETLAERGWRTLGEACAHRLAVGKRDDGLPLPFPILDDGSVVRAPIVGRVAGLRAADGSLRCAARRPPLVTSAMLLQLAAACRDVARFQHGPLPGASAGPLSARSRAERWPFTPLPPVSTWPSWQPTASLANVNAPHDLEALALA